MSTNPQEWPAPPPLGSSGRPRRGEFFVGWVYGPWVAASLISVLALRLLLPAQEGSSRADGRPGPGQPARSGAGSRYNVVGRLYNDLEGIP